jgi:hypothetical protein
MLSGIILQPGAWDQTRGPLDDVLVANNVMENVAAPVTLWNKPGNTVGKVTISGLHANGVYRSAISAESWSDTPITNFVLRGVQVEFAGGAGAWAAGQTVQSASVDARPLPSWGFYGRNIQTLAIEDSRFRLASDDRRPVISAEKVERMSLSGVRYPDISGVAAAVVTTNVVKFTQTP